MQKETQTVEEAVKTLKQQGLTIGEALNRHHALMLRGDSRNAAKYAAYIQDYYFGRK